MLKNILKEFELILSIYNVPVLNLLRPGVGAYHFQELIKELDISLDSDVFELFSWRNGTEELRDKAIGELTLFNNGIFHSLEECISQYRYNAIDNNYWDKQYFPLFSSGGGDYLLINTGDNQLTGTIFIISPSILFTNQPTSIYDSLECLFKSLLRCYQMKAYHFEEGFLEENIDDVYEICASYNPRSEFWVNK